MECTCTRWGEKRAEVPWHGMPLSLCSPQFHVWYTCKFFLFFFLKKKLIMCILSRLTWLALILRTITWQLGLEIILLGQFSVMSGMKTWPLKKVSSYWKNACVCFYTVIGLLSTKFRYYTVLFSCFALLYSSLLCSSPPPSPLSIFHLSNILSELVQRLKRKIEMYYWEWTGHMNSLHPGKVQAAIIPCQTYLRDPEFSPTQVSNYQDTQFS